MIGGDLAYPNPTADNYESRFLRVFEDAMPSPPNAPMYFEDHVSLQKPAIKEGTKLNEYEGPLAYVIPGNHDWYDGLGSFVKYILHRDWLGGWLMPQTKSYFVLRLPQNFYIFGFDNGVEDDINPTQAAYFAKYANNNLDEQAKVILVQHDPNWVKDQYSAERSDDPRKKKTGKHIEFLMNGPLLGKVVLRLAGDVHNYMRHTPFVEDGEEYGEEINAKSRDSFSSSVDDYYDDDDDDDDIRERKMERSSFTRPNNSPTLIISGGGGAFLHPTHIIGDEILNNVAGTGGKTYSRDAAYPTSETSQALSWLNFTKFRKRNWRFDAIGGTIYLLLAHSLFTDCSVVPTALDKATMAFTDSNNNILDMFALFCQNIYASVGVVISGSQLSLFVSVCLWIFCINAVDSGKTGLKISFGTFHFLVHLYSSAAINIAIDWCFLMLFSGRAGSVTRGTTTNSAGLPSVLEPQWTKFQTRYPDGARVLDFAGNYTFGAVPSLVRYSMLVADSPATQVYIKTHIYCGGTPEGEDISSFISNNNAKILYAILRTCWYWVFACPIVSTVVASYLWFCLNILKMHWNEGFSSLQHTGFKNFIRMKITKKGDLEIYSIGIDKVPTKWELDLKHEQYIAKSNKKNNLNEAAKSFEWKVPSRWKVKGEKDDVEARGMNAKIVDHVVIG